MTSAEKAPVGPTTTGDAPTDASFSHVFTSALRGHPCHVVGIEAEPQHLPVTNWLREPDDDDEALLALCQGPTIDIGCGPGRLTAALAARGQVALGIDVVHEAVGQTRERGGVALHRDVYDELPGEGRWATALLADGNLGIGGDPVSLLRRAHELVDPRGRVVVEVEASGIPLTTTWASLECNGARSRPFRWSVVGLDDIADLAAQAGLVVGSTHAHGERWYVVLTGPS